MENRSGVAMTATIESGDVIPQWIRGPATIKDGKVVLELAKTEWYLLTEATQVAIELANLDPLDEEKAKRFVRQFGLLDMGKDNIGEHSYDEMAFSARTFKQFLLLRADIHKALKGDIPALSRLSYHVYKHHQEVILFDGDMPENMRKKADLFVRLYENNHWGQHRAGLWTPEQEREVIYASSLLLSQFVSANLDAITVGVVPEMTLARERRIRMDNARLGVFGIEHQAQDLLSYAYLRLMYLIVDKEPLGECPECGKFFERGQRQKTYCSEACGSSRRATRFKERRSQTS